MPVFLIIVLILVIIFMVRIRYLDRNRNAALKTEEYLKKDFESNFSRTRRIDPEMFITLKEAELPFRYDYDGNVKEEAAILKIQKKIKLSLEVPIIKTDIQSNIEIKERFGAANLPVIADGEDNHTRLIRGLNTWARLLLEMGRRKEAETVLEAAVFARSDISETYVLLYGLYTEDERFEKAEELYGKIMALPDTAGRRALHTINDKYPQGD